MLANLDTRAGPDVAYAMDNWSGYPAARAEFIRTITRHARNRSVVLTGDNHANWVNEIRAPDPRGDGTFATAEFLGTSVSSGGDGADRSSYVTDAVLADNPHVRWQNGRRGYMVCEATPSEWRTEFRTVPFVARPDAPVATATRWRLAHGRPGIEREG
jgi:alkaline phosphatase D